jgi:dCTP diphosphatase
VQRDPQRDGRWLFHIVERARWERGDEPYAPESLAREGFVHCSYRDAVAESAQLYFAKDAALVVLEIDPVHLDAHINVAATPRGPMPHVHGAIPRDAVRAVLSVDEVSSRDDRKRDDSLSALMMEVRAFNAAREWRQFHSPKNLAMALTIEAAELSEPFRWDTDGASWQRAETDAGRAHLRNEMADVLLLLLSLADYNEIDLAAAARAKLALNASRYPEEQAKGRSDKYTAYVRRSDRATDEDEDD